MTPATLELSTTGARTAGARSSLYRSIALGFAPPSPSLHEAVGQGRFAADMRQASEMLPYGLPIDPDVMAGATPSLQTLEDTYVALFEIGGEYGAPIFLYEGEHGGGRMKVLDEVLRFYHWFGLRLGETGRDRPDHLATELEFMHALAFMEVNALAEGRDASPVRRAEHDFLRFHLHPFVTGVAEGLAAKNGAPFYPGLAHSAALFCQGEMEYLRAS